MSEIILTILALIVLCWTAMRSMPYLVEWLESISIDETTDRRE